MYQLVKEFMQGENKEMFLNPMYSDFFITLCQSVYEIVEGNTSDGFVDRAGIVADTYDLIFQPLFLIMLRNNEGLMKELEKQVKYNSVCKIVFPEDLKLL